MKLIYAALLALPVLAGCSNDDEPVAPEAVEWNYENTDWQTQGYPDCGNNVQSPVDIVPANVIKATLPNVGHNFTPFAMKIVDVGHTVQVINTGTNTVTVYGKTYTVAQFHFHHRSEHTVNGRSYPLEMHVVCADPNPTTNTNVVLAIFFEESTTNNAFLAKVFNQIPPQPQLPVQTQDLLSLDNVLPADPHYYTYVGSLTTPPCTAGVDWVIFQQPMTVSTAQLAQFTRRYPDNARPTQPLKARVIYQN